MHVKATRYVKASAQSRIVEVVYDKFTDEENRIPSRRNAKSATIPKHADVIDYRRSTAFEAVLGYLYLIGRKERLLEILDMAAKVIEEGEGPNGQ